MPDHNLIHQYLAKARRELRNEPVANVHYIPFPKAEEADPGDTRPIRERANDFKKEALMRSVAIQVNKPFDGGPRDTTQDELNEAFGNLSENERMEVARNAVRREPLILQQGDPDLKKNASRINQNTTVYVLGHGTNESASLWNTPDLRKEGDSKIDAAQLVEQMKGNGVPMDVQKIKLIACGSGGSLLQVMALECAKQDAFPKATIRGYGQNDSHVMFDHEAPLQDLHLGMHNVASDRGHQLSERLDEVTSELRSLERNMKFLDDRIQENQARIAGYDQSIAVLTADIDDLKQQLDQCPAATPAEQAAYDAHQATQKEVGNEYKKAAKAAKQLPHEERKAAEAANAKLKSDWRDKKEALKPMSSKLKDAIIEKESSLRFQTSMRDYDQKVLKENQATLAANEKSFAKLDKEGVILTLEKGALPSRGRERGRDQGFEVQVSSPHLVVSVREKLRMEQARKNGDGPNIIVENDNPGKKPRLKSHAK